MIDSLEQIVKIRNSLEIVSKINNDLSEHLICSIIQLLRYGEKYDVVVPKKKQLEQILLNTKFLLEEKHEAVDKFNALNSYFNDQPTKNTTNNNQRLNRTLKQVLLPLRLKKSVLLFG